jgi:hypothetical protein
MDAKIVENKTIRSFNALKRDLDKLAAWVVWNRNEHEILVSRINYLESLLEPKKPVKYVASQKSKKVHKEKTSHAKRILGANRQCFDMIADASRLGYEVCECAA